MNKRLLILGIALILLAVPIVKADVSYNQPVDDQAPFWHEWLAKIGLFSTQASIQTQANPADMFCKNKWDCTIDSKNDYRINCYASSLSSSGCLCSRTSNSSVCASKVNPIMYDVDSQLPLFSISTFTPIGSNIISPNQNVAFTLSEKLLQSCPKPAYLTLEVYNAPTDQQTTTSYVGGSSLELKTQDSSITEIPSGKSYLSTFSYIFPSTARGTWSVSSYIYCPAKNPAPASQYSTVTGKNIQISSTAPSSCTSECSSGSTTCITMNGFRNRYVSTCGNYDTDSCTEYKTSGLIDCGGTDLCSGGKCITAPATTTVTTQTTTQSTSSTAPKIVLNGDVKIIPTPFHECTNLEPNQPNYQCVADTDTIYAEVPIKNIGTDMQVPWIMELKPAPVGTNLIQAIVSPTQGVCDSKTPQNIYRSFQLKSGETALLTFTSKVKIQAQKPYFDRFDLTLYTVTGCCNSANGCNKVDGLYDEIIGEVNLRAPSESSNIVCGDGRCDYGINGRETIESCPKDCSNVDICSDGACHGSETKDNCPQDCTPPDLVFIGNCEKGYVKDLKYGACCKEGYTYDITDKLCHVSCTNSAICSGKSLSLEYGDWKETTPLERVKTLCTDKSSCEPYEGDEGKNYSVSCEQTNRIRSKLSADADELCKAHPATINLHILSGIGGSIGGCSAGALVGVIFAGIGAPIGCVVGGVLGATTAVTTTTGIATSLVVNCKDKTIPESMGACIAVPKGGAGTFARLTEEHDIFGVSVPTWGIVAGVIVLLMILPTLLGGVKK